jgi:predicted metalloprotease with PDZ domain
MIISTFSFSKIQNDSIYYTISPSKTSYALHIKLRFSARGSETKLYFPNSWASETMYYKCIKNLVVNNKNEQHLINENKLTADSLGNITYNYYSKSSVQQYIIEYDLIQDTIQNLIYNGKYAGQFRPIIQKDFFQINGYQFMLLPDIIYDTDTSYNTSIKITFENFNSKWNFVGSLISKNNSMLIPHNYPDYFQNIGIVGTTNKIYSCSINKCHLNIVNLNGTHQFNDTIIINKAKRVMEYQLKKVWKDTLLRNYSISLVEYKTAVDENIPSFYNGTALNDIFLVATSSNAIVEDLDYLFGHELTHHWIGGKIDFEGNNFTASTWFREGFTDYMTITNSYKYKLVSFEQFIKNVNAIITEYYCSPVAEIPNDSLVNNFWKDYNYNKLPYRRGFIFAMYLNYLMKEHSNAKYNFSDFMLELYNWSIKNNNKKLSNTLFISMVNEHVSLPIDIFFNQHIIDGKLIEIDEWNFKDASFLYYVKTKCNNKIIEIPQFKEKATF